MEEVSKYGVLGGIVMCSGIERGYWRSTAMG